MKTTISNFSNERLESEIANIYYAAAKEAPGVALRETGNLGLLWDEFDRRFDAREIDQDTEWTPRQEWE